MSTQAQQSSAKLKLYFYDLKDKIVSAEGIYRAGSEQLDPKTGKTTTKWEGSFFERPWIDGKRSWRSLETESFKIAQERLLDRKRAIQRGENPYATIKTASEKPAPYPTATKAPVVPTAATADPAQKSESDGAVLVKACLDAYVKAKYPDRNRELRPADTVAAEIGYITQLRKFWDPICVDDISMMAMDDYHDARMSANAVAEREKARKEIEALQELAGVSSNLPAMTPEIERPKFDVSAVERVTKGTGNRTVDLELNTLRNALHYSARIGLIKGIPMHGCWPRYQNKKKVQHCKNFMANDADEVHEIGGYLYGHGKSAVLCFQWIFENYSGLRTCEVLQLRTNAAPYEPGYITPDGKSLYVRRGKGQEEVNAVVFIHDGLAAWIDAHRKWKEKFYPDSPWFFPSPYDPSQPVHGDALCHALGRLRKQINRKGKDPLPPVIKRKITSHGARAWYVTVRRSHGILDSQIAIEIGHTSDGATLAEVYGGCPPSWLAGYGPKMSWLPKGKLAWDRKPQE